MVSNFFIFPVIIYNFFQKKFEIFTDTSFFREITNALFDFLGFIFNSENLIFYLKYLIIVFCEGIIVNIQVKTKQSTYAVHRFDEG